MTSLFRTAHRKDALLPSSRRHLRPPAYVWIAAALALSTSACGDDGSDGTATEGSGGAATTSTSDATTSGETTGGQGGGDGGAGQGGAGDGGSGGSGGAGSGGGDPVCGTPAAIGFVEMEDGEEAFDVAIEGTTLYVTLESDGIRAFDVSNPLAPVARGIVNLPNAKRVVVEDAVAYVTQLGSGFAAVDFSDPDAPAIVGEPFTTNRTFYDVVRLGGHSLLATDGLAVLADGDAGPELVILVEDGGGRGLAAEGTVLFAANLIFGLNAYDVTDVEAPELVATFDEDLSIEALDVRGGVLLTGGSGTGLVRIDAADPLAMAITGTTGEQSVSDVRFVRDGLALVAAGDDGVLVVDTTTDAATIVATIPTAGKANGIAVGDGLVAVAEEGGGVVLVNPCPIE